MTNIGHMLEELTILVHRRSRGGAAEVAEVRQFFASLAEREAAGALTETEARAQIIRFGVRKLRQRQAS